MAPEMTQDEIASALCLEIALYIADHDYVPETLVTNLVWERDQARYGGTLTLTHFKLAAAGFLFDPLGGRRGFDAYPQEGIWHRAGYEGDAWTWTGKIAAGSITAAKISAGSITAAKIASLVSVP